MTLNDGLYPMAYQRDLIITVNGGGQVREPINKSDLKYDIIPDIQLHSSPLWGREDIVPCF